MAYEITHEEVWAGTIQDHSGGLLEKLEPVAKAGVNLEFIIARRTPENPGTGVVFMAPLRGTAATQLAEQIGLSRRTSGHTLRIDGPDRPLLAMHMAQAVANAGISVRGVSAAKLLKHAVCYITFDSAQEADRACQVLNQVLNV